MEYPFIESLRKRLVEEIKLNISIIAAGLGTSKSISPSDISFKNITINLPKNKDFGDLTTNAAMVMASVFSQNPLKIAGILSDTIFKSWKEFKDIKILPPGFMNFFISGEFIKEQLALIADKNGSFGKNETGNGKKVQIEFVSANPTGDLHIGHGRWASLGDSLSNIYSANGYNVWREYYVNDYGTQIKVFTECIVSLYLRAFKIDCIYPEEGYPEELIKGVADEILNNYGDKFLKKENAAEPDNVDSTGLQYAGVRIMLERISSTLSSMKVIFDEWFRESSLYDNSNFDKTLKYLEGKGLTYMQEGALWFRTSDFGDDKDRVVIRSDGEPTYFASDIMYLINKIARGFEKIIYILGADHHGYVKRVQAIAGAVGFDSKNVKVIIGQLVRLVKKGQVVRMSKRKGKVYSLDDLIKEVGSDAIRYFFSANSFDTPMDFDISLAKQKSNTNPVYYVQYAHARIANVVQKVIELQREGKLIYDKNRMEFGRLKLAPFDLDYLNKFVKMLIQTASFNDIKIKNNDETELAKLLLFYPDIIYDACINDAPYLVNQYVYKLAAQFHYFYKHNRIIDQAKLNIDRFKLILCVRVVLVNALRILQIGTPAKM